MAGGTTTGGSSRHSQPSLVRAKPLRITAFLALTLLALTACTQATPTPAPTFSPISRAAPTPSPTPAPTPTLTPTPTSTPTPTPIPTPSPTPTPTLTPTPTPTSLLLHPHLFRPQPPPQLLRPRLLQHPSRHPRWNHSPRLCPPQQYYRMLKRRRPIVPRSYPWSMSRWPSRGVSLYC